MGCTHYHRLSTEHEALSKRFAQIVAEKNVFYNDKILLETEISQLKKNAYQALHESETIKAKFDEHQSTEVPEVFENESTESSLIADMLEMDWKDGDRLLDAMSALNPSTLPAITKLKTESAYLSTHHCTLKNFLAYFLHRYDFFNSVWRDALAAQKQIDLSVHHLKEDIVAEIIVVESFIGKRSEIDDELHAEFRRIAALPPSLFLVEQRNIMRRLSALKTEMMNKKLDEKDTEKQRIVHLFQHEIAKIHETYKAEQARSKAELTQEYKQQLKSEFDAQTKSFTLKEEQYKSRICMLTEDLLANTVRIQHRQENIHNILSEEIEQRINETKLLQEANRQEKAISSILKYEEVQQVKKEAEMLKRELAKSAELRREEIEKLGMSFAKRESSIVSEAKKECEILQNQLEKTISAHKDEIALLKRTFATENSASIIDIKAECDNLKAELQKIIEKHREETEKVKNDCENEALLRLEKAKNELEALQIELKNREFRYESEIEQCKNDFAKKESGLLKSAIMECEKLKKERIALLQSQKDEITRLKAGFSDRESSNRILSQLEYDNLKAELVNTAQSYNEQLEKQQQMHLAELEEQNKAFADLRVDFSKRIEAEKRKLEEKMNLERVRFGEELYSARIGVDILSKELKMKDLLLADLQKQTSKQNSGETLQSQIISVLKAKIELIDIECESRVRSIASRHFPRLHFNEAQSSKLEIDKTSIIASLRASSDLHKSTNSEENNMREETMKILKKPPNRLEGVLLEFETEIKAIKSQLEAANSEKTEAENQVLKLKTQTSEKNKRINDLESALEALNKRKKAASRFSALEPPLFELDKGQITPKLLESPLSTDPDETPASLNLPIFSPSGSIVENRKYRASIEPGLVSVKKPAKLWSLSKGNKRTADGKTEEVDGKTKAMPARDEVLPSEALLSTVRKEAFSQRNKKLRQPKDS